MSQEKQLQPYITQVRGIAFKPSEISAVPFEGSIAILKANNITEDGLDDSSLIYIDAKRVKEVQIIKRGDLLLAASSGIKKIIGKNIYFPKDSRFTFGVFCKVVRPKAGIHPPYLKHFFQTRHFRNVIEQSVQGANISNLKNEHLDGLQIRIPPLEDQKRIAYLLSIVEGLIAQRKKHVQQIDDFLKSVFFNMFGDPVRNEKGLTERRLGTLFSVKHGFAFKSECFSDGEHHEARRRITQHQMAQYASRSRLRQRRCGFRNSG